MNPVIRAVYQKAINNFANIPEDKQMEVMQLVMELETAAREGNQMKMMQLYKPLNEALKGVP